MDAILALDLGKKTGWALYAEGRVASGTYQIKTGRFQGGGVIFLNFERDFLNSFKAVGRVYFEEVRRHIGTDAAHMYGGLLATLTSWCEVNAIPYQGVPVGTIKKHITGKGNAGKAQVIEAVKAKGFNPADDNEADALAILDYVRHLYNVKR
jgi:hypothetical protein